LIIRTQGGKKSGLDQIRVSLDVSQEMQFTGHDREEIYEWVGNRFVSTATREKKLLAGGLTGEMHVQDGEFGFGSSDGRGGGGIVRYR
jgi:hypothetical protein